MRFINWIFFFGYLYHMYFSIMYIYITQSKTLKNIVSLKSWFYWWTIFPISIDKNKINLYNLVWQFFVGIRLTHVYWNRHRANGWFVSFGNYFLVLFSLTLFTSEFSMEYICVHFWKFRRIRSWSYDRDSCCCGIWCKDKLREDEWSRSYCKYHLFLSYQLFIFPSFIIRLLKTRSMKLVLKSKNSNLIKKMLINQCPQICYFLWF